MRGASHNNREEGRYKINTISLVTNIHCVWPTVSCYIKVLAMAKLSKKNSSKNVHLELNINVKLLAGLLQPSAGGWWM